MDSSEKEKRPTAPAQIHFREQEKQLREMNLSERFTHIYQTNLWGETESVSGPGSGMQQTAVIRAALPQLLRELGINSLLDIPCGDFHWMSQTKLPISRYIGADVVAEVVRRNNEQFAREGKGAHGSVEFLRLDLTQDLLPEVDLIFCRDCLVHLSFTNISRALKNIHRSGAKYLLTTTFTEFNSNLDITDGDWRPLNFQRPPFNLPAPERILFEGCTEQDGAYADKALGLWQVSSLPVMEFSA